MNSIPDQTPRRARPLSKRETAVLELAARGLTNQEIADRLGVTVHGVKFHMASIFRKLHVANRTEAAVTFLRGDVVSREERPPRYRVDDASDTRTPGTQSAA